LDFTTAVRRSPASRLCPGVKARIRSIRRPSVPFPTRAMRVVTHGRHRWPTARSCRWASGRLRS